VVYRKTACPDGNKIQISVKELGKTNRQENIGGKKGIRSGRREKKDLLPEIPKKKGGLKKRATSRKRGEE